MNTDSVSLIGEPKLPHKIVYKLFLKIIPTERGAKGRHYYGTADRAVLLVLKTMAV